MNKRVFMIHGWGGFPEEGWRPWLREELEKRRFTVSIPTMPQPDKPRIDTWVPFLSSVVRTPDKDTYFVGHSMGCQTIARYLETLPDDIKVGGAVFVAGFFKRLTGLEDDPDVQETDKHWLETPVDFQKIKSHLPRSIAIFSDNDPWVPLDNQNDFKEKLGSKIIIEHGMSHFSGDDGIVKLPIALDALLKLADEN